MNNLLFCLNATVPVFLVMMAGYILRCMKMLDESFVNKLNHLNFKVTLPILLMMDIASTDFYQALDFRFVLFCFLVTLGSILGITVFAILFIKKKSILGEFIQASYRGSAAVLGIAFVQNIYGRTSVAPLMVFATVPLYNVMAVVILLFAVPHNHIKKKSEMIKESMLGAPTAVSAYIMARNTGYEGVLSSGCIVFSTFLSSITISFWLFVLKLIYDF